MSANPGSIHRKRWEKVKTLFQRAYPLDERERGDLLVKECHGDPDLRAEVEALLASDDSTGCLDRFLEVGPAEWRFENLSKRMVGARLGPFRVERGIAAGGMGEVYLATRVDGDFDQTVAIKILKLGMDSEDLLGRFRAERRTLAALEHPNIARLIDGGSTADGRPYFAMEYVCGTPIDQYCDDRDLTVLKRLELFLVVCGAVQYAHQNLVVHRDLKPGNILVTDDGLPKLLDFGIAKLLTPALDGDGTAMLAGHHRLLTPSYASPEQIRGTRITTATDVYSLGLVLYKMLTGQLPFQCNNLSPLELDRVLCEIEIEGPSQFIERDAGIESANGETATNIDTDSPTGLRSHRADQLRRRLRGDIDNIVLMALRKDPSRRYTSVEQFAADIRRHLAGQPVVARKDTTSYRLGKFFKRNKATVASAVIIAITLMAGAANTLWQSRVVRTERDHAVEARKQSESLTAFLQNTLFFASPHRRGADTTVYELLGDAAGRVGAELAGDVESQANVHYAIGETYAALGKHQPANEHLRTALKSYRRLYGSDHERTARCLMELGSLLADRRDGEGVGLLEEALAIRRRLYGDDNQLVADIKCHLAYALWHASEPAQLARSEALMDEAHRAYRLHLADGHVRFAMWTHAMGGVRTGQNRTQDAVELYQRARNMFLAAGAENHPNYISLLKHMSWSLQRLDRYAEARLVHSEYMDRRRVVFGAEWVLEDQWELATKDTVFGNPVDALQGYQSWLILRCEGFVKDAELNVESASAIQAFLHADLTYDHPESASHYHKVLTTLMNQDLFLALEARLTMFRVGKAYYQLGNHKGAKMLLEGCLEIRFATMDDYTPCADAEGWLGVTKAALGDYENAAEHLNTSYQAFVEFYGTEHELTYRAVNRLVDVYRSWGRPDQAESISQALCYSNDPIDPSRVIPSDPIRVQKP